jgi:acyl-CoA reductase-like NAD-dependent aldehyde dehydrogenase
MTASAAAPASRPPIRESLRIAGEKVSRDRVIEVRHPYSGELIGTVPKATCSMCARPSQIARNFRSPLTRHERYEILMKAGAIMRERATRSRA